MPSLATRRVLRLRLEGPRDQDRHVASYPFQGHRRLTRPTADHHQIMAEVRTTGRHRTTVVDPTVDLHLPPHLLTTADRTDARRLLMEAAHTAVRRRLRPTVVGGHYLHMDAQCLRTAEVAVDRCPPTAAEERRRVVVDSVEAGAGPPVASVVVADMLRPPATAPVVVAAVAARTQADTTVTKA
jgi:hypothetical protein